MRHPEDRAYFQRGEGSGVEHPRAILCVLRVSQRNSAVRRFFIGGEKIVPCTKPASLILSSRPPPFTLDTVKIALGQINPTVGDFSGNATKIIEFSRRARKRRRRPHSVSRTRDQRIPSARSGGAARFCRAQPGISGTIAAETRASPSSAGSSLRPTPKPASRS